MAQRKPNISAQKRPGSNPPPGSKTGPGARPPVRKPNKSIVNQKQTPWGLIGVTAAIVAFAVAIVVVVVTHKDKKAAPTSAGADVSKCTKMIGNNKTTYLNELVCAKDISGVKFYSIDQRQHVTSLVTYPQSPPVGGNHSQYWADCTGTVYTEPIANENAVHMLEHGAVWITYNAKTLPDSQLTTLQTLVSGQDREALSPYPDLSAPISLQSWGYQLFVNSASDPRIKEFINALRYNPLTTPEYSPGVTCSDPAFDPSKSTPGHPQF